MKRIACLLGCLALAAALRAAPADEIRHVTDDPRRYSGEAPEKLADFKSEEQALAHGRAAALEQLCMSIGVHLHSEFKDQLFQDAHGGGETVHSDLSVFVSKTLVDITYRTFREHPHPGYITVLAFVDKAACDRSAEGQLKAVEQKVSTSLDAAAEARQQGDYGLALVSLASARRVLDAELGGAAIQVTAERKRQDAGGYVEAHLTGILQHLRLSAEPARLLYDARGALKKRPHFKVGYQGAGTADLPVAGLPLLIELAGAAPGAGTFTARTGVDGEASILLDAVPLGATDPGYALTVALDMGALGLDPSRPGPAPLAVPLSKVRIVALAGNRVAGGQVTADPRLVEALKGSLAGSGYATVDLAVDGQDVSDADLYRAAAAKADYLVYQRQSLSVSKDVLGLCTASCRRKLTVHDVASRSLVKAFEGKPASAESADLGDAEAQALAKAQAREGAPEAQLPALLK